MLAFRRSGRGRNVEGDGRERDKPRIRLGLVMLKKLLAYASEAMVSSFESRIVIWWWSSKVSR